MPFSTLSQEVQHLIVDALSSHRPSLIACSLTCRALSEAASLHLFLSCKFAVNVRSRPLSLLLHSLSLQPRLRTIEHLYLVRADRASGSESMNRSGSGGPGEKRKRSKRRGSSAEVEFTPPEDEHATLFQLHSLLLNLPKLRSLHIRHLHILIGEPFTIHPRFSIHTLSFEGTDTANSYYSVLALFTDITLLSVSDNYDKHLMPVRAAPNLETFPYATSVTIDKPLSFHTIKIFSCIPEIMGAWFAACVNFSKPFLMFTQLLLDEMCLVFEHWREAYEKALRPIWSFTARIDVDFTAGRPLFPARACEHLFPSLPVPAFLASTRFLLREGQKTALYSIEKFVLGARNPGGSSRLCEIHITVVFPQAPGAPTDRDEFRQRLNIRQWTCLIRIVRGLAWGKAIRQDDKFVRVKLVDALEQDGGKVCLTEMLWDMLMDVTKKDEDVRKFLRCG